MKKITSPFVLISFPLENQFPKKRGAGLFFSSVDAWKAFEYQLVNTLELQH